MDEPTTPTPLASLVDAVVSNGGMVHGLLSHMEASQASGFSAPDAPPPPDVLRTLLTEILEPRVADLEGHDLAAAAAVLHSVSVAMETELLLVPVRPRRHRPAPRRRPRRR
jgi:hypothetical protein